jgi:DNA-binding protein YbaB
MSQWARLVAKVDAMEDDFRRVQLAGEKVAALTIAHPIAGDLGTVHMGGSGRLLDIELEKTRLRFTTAAALGTQLLGAIRDAEEEVREMRREILAEARGEHVRSH